MYYVYMLQSFEDHLYLGSTNDLRRRLKEHVAGEPAYTSKRGTNWQIVYYEAYKREADARAREKRLKQQGQAMVQLKRRIKSSLADKS